MKQNTGLKWVNFFKDKDITMHFVPYIYQSNYIISTLKGFQHEFRM